MLGANVTENDEKFIVDCASVPKEGEDNTLDTFDADRVKWRAQIRRIGFWVLMP